MAHFDFQSSLLLMPPRALIALLGRAARRAVPLYRSSLQGLDARRECEALHTAVSIADAIAGGDETWSDEQITFVENVVKKAKEDSVANQDFRCAALCRGIDHLCRIMRELIGGGSAQSLESVIDTAIGDSRNPAEDGERWRELFDPAVQSDFSVLSNQELSSVDPLGNPIDTSSDGPMGPLWPHGTPDEYTKGLDHLHDLRKATDELLGNVIRDSNPEPLIAVCFDDSGFDDDDVQLVLQYLDELYAEQGGVGLKVVTGNALSPEFAEEVLP